MGRFVHATPNASTPCRPDPRRTVSTEQAAAARLRAAEFVTRLETRRLVQNSWNSNLTRLAARSWSGVGGFCAQHLHGNGGAHVYACACRTSMDVHVTIP